MNVRRLGKSGLTLFEPVTYEDERGRFLELWNDARYRTEGVDKPFVQDNVSYSGKGVLRGLHYQWRRPQGKLISVLQGEVLDVALDLRVDHGTFGEWVAVSLSAANAHQLYIPEGFAHGFAVVSEGALVTYKCTEAYDPDAEITIAWNDPDLAITWPVADPIVSAKDRSGVLLKDVPKERWPQKKTQAPMRRGDE